MLFVWPKKPKLFASVAKKSKEKVEFSRKKKCENLGEKFIIVQKTESFGMKRQISDENQTLVTHKIGVEYSFKEVLHIFVIKNYPAQNLLSGLAVFEVNSKLHPVAFAGD